MRNEGCRRAQMKIVHFDLKPDNLLLEAPLVPGRAWACPASRWPTLACPSTSGRATCPACATCGARLAQWFAFLECKCSTRVELRKLY